MSEPITNSNATEGGGPPIEPPAIGGKGTEKPFEGMDGKSYTGSQMPPGKPRARRRAAPPAEPTGDPAKESPQIGAAPGAPQATKEPVPGEEQQPAKPTGLEALRRPGEPDAEFYPRIHQEDRARLHKLEREHDQLTGRAETALRQAAAEIQRLTALVQPMATRQQEEEERARREEIMSRIPDRETQPQEYQLLLQEEILRRQLDWEARQKTEKEEQQQQAQERQQQEQLEAYLADRDEGIQRELGEAMEADPAFAQQLAAHLQFTAYQLRQFDPAASDEDIKEVVYLTHLKEAADARERGIPLRDYYREQARVLQETARLLGMQPGNGNGQPPAAPAPAVPSPESPQVGSPTAARVAREAARSQTASGGPGRPGGATPGEPNLPTRRYQSEDEYVRAGLRNEFDENWIRDALGKPAGERASRRR